MTPMNELEFEHIFMARVVTDKEFLSDVYSAGNPEEVAQYPVNEENQILLDKLFGYFGKCGQLPSLDVLKVYIDDGPDIERVSSAWARAMSVDSTIDRDVLYALTEKYLRDRGLHWVIVQASHGRIDGAEVVEKANKAIGIRLDKNLGYDVVADIGSFCDKMTATVSTITTGYKWLDEQLGGGWICGEPALYIFAGETNVGKSVLLMQFAIAAFLAGKNALIVSLEMSQFMYSKRIYANLCDIRMGELSQRIEEVRDTIESQDPTRGKLVVKEFPTGTLSVPQLEGYLEDLKRSGFVPDVIFVDYLNLMTAHSKDKKKYEEIGELAVGLRRLSYTYAPVVTATQLNRSGMGRANPGLDKTADSVEGSFCADFQASIFQLPEHREMGVINIGIQKTRFGDKGKVKMFGVDFPKMTIRELDETTEGVMGVAVVDERSQAEAFEDVLS